MKKILIILISILVLAPLIQAFEINDSNLSCIQIEMIKEEFLGGKIPSMVPYQNEVINIYLKNESFGNLKIENGNFSDFSCGLSEKGTYDLRINDFQIFLDFNSNSSVIKELNKKITSGEIEVEGLGFGKDVKWFFTKIALKIANLF